MIAVTRLTAVIKQSLTSRESIPFCEFSEKKSGIENATLSKTVVY